MDLGNVLKGKKVKIEEKNFGNHVNALVYKGTIEDTYACGENRFIKLAEGTIINVRYIASIEIIE